MRSMLYFIRITKILVCFLFVYGCSSSSGYKYPQLKNVKSTVKHFDTSYQNTFENLEDFNKPIVKSWFDKQDSLTEGYFDTDDFKKYYHRNDTLYNRASDPARKVTYTESNHTFYFSLRSEQDATKKGKVLYRKLKGNDEAEFLYDPFTYLDGSFKVSSIYPSYNGNYVALVMKNSKQFFNHIIILDCTSKKIIGTPLTNTKPEKAGGVIWSPDSKSILFISYPNFKGDQNDRDSYLSRYYLTKLDEEPESVFSRGNGGINFRSEYFPIPRFRSKNSNYAFVYIGNANDYWDCYYLPVNKFLKEDYKWKLLHEVKDSIYYSYGTEKDHKFYFKREKNNNTELCWVDMKSPNFTNPFVIDSGKDEMQIGKFKVVNNNIYYSKVKNGIESFLYKYNESEGIKKIQLPKEAGLIGFDYRSPYQDDLWIEINGWTSSYSEFYLNPETEDFEFVSLGSYPLYPEFNNIISEVIEVPSYDGTKVPMSIVRRKDHPLDGSGLGIIVAYGAYGLSETPFFHTPLLDFVNNGYIYATAHVRGGGEKGPAWHKAGMKTTKENSWKDLIACSEYLINNGYIHLKKLGLNVTSAGGITGGMAVNERSDLFGTFTASVPNFNVIRTEYLDSFDDSDMIFEFGTIKDEKSYKSLLAMDPIINLKRNANYPSSLVIMGFRDYLIPPSSPGKYIASLQEFCNYESKKPYLLDVKFDAEHDFNWIDDFLRILYFTEKELKNR